MGGALLAAVARTSASQSVRDYPQVRSGFTASAGIGASPASSDCPKCTNIADELGGVAFARLGWSVLRNVTLAVRGDGWLNKGTNETRSYTAVVVEALYYPLTETGWFVEAGGGKGRTYFDHPNDDPFPTRLESKGTAILIGTGYDFRLTRNFSVTPYISSEKISRGPLEFTRGSFGSPADYGVRITQLGVGFTLH
jgi:hypothetical protein